MSSLQLRWPFFALAATFVACVSDKPSLKHEGPVQSAVAQVAPKQAGPPSAPPAPRAPPPPPLANGALFSFKAGHVFDVQHAYSSQRMLRLGDDGTVIIIDHDDHESGSQLMMAKDYGRDVTNVFRAKESWMLLDSDGTMAVSVGEANEAAETIPLETFKSRKLERNESGPPWLARLRSPVSHVNARFIGASPDGVFTVWGYIGAVVGHVYAHGPNGTADIEGFPPRRVAIRNDGKAIFFKVERNFSAERDNFFGKSYDLKSVDGTKKALDELSSINDSRLDVGAYCAAPHPSGFAVGYEDGRIVVTEVTMRTALTTLRVESAVVALAVSPDGKMLASSHADGAVYVWKQ